jgi:hypothetical protein
MYVNHPLSLGVCLEFSARERVFLSIITHNTNTNLLKMTLIVLRSSDCVCNRVWASQSSTECGSQNSAADAKFPHEQRVQTISRERKVLSL